MGLRNLFTRRTPELRREPRLEFLGEQDGPNERELKAALIRVLDEVGSVEMAYLARVGFHPAAPPSVALCVRASAGVEHAIVRRVNEVTYEMLPRDAFLDVVFLSLEQHQELASVCIRFYPPTV